VKDISRKYYKIRCKICNHEIIVLDKTDDICGKCGLEIDDNAHD
jgi:ribosomal protein S27E